MASDAENLATIRSNILAAMATATVSPKPSYTIDGQTVNWTQYYESLLKQLQTINDLMASIAEPWEQVVEGMP